MVRYRVAKVTCAIDGASQETYVRYRKRGNYDRVIDNIRRVNHFKRTLGSELPLLSWQFIAFGHNEHEIPVARALAAELGMQFYVKLNWDPDFSPIVDEEAIRTATRTGVASRTEFLEKYGSDYLGDMCMQLWKHPQINWDGKVLGCCRNFWGDFGGNAFRDGLHPKPQSRKDVLCARDAGRQESPRAPTSRARPASSIRAAQRSNSGSSATELNISEKTIAQLWMRALAAANERRVGESGCDRARSASAQTG